MSDMTATLHPGKFDQASRARAAASVNHPLTRALLVLTFTTGMVDAVSYLGLGRVFSANMTGNIVLLGFGIAGAAGLPVIAPIVSLAAFLLGAAFGGVLDARIGELHPRHMATTLCLEVSLFALAAVITAVLTVKPNTVAGDVVIGLLAFSMGCRNATVRRLAIPDLTTTVLTMTLTGFAADSRLTGASGKGSTRRALAVLAMFSGALAGGLLLRISLVIPLGLAAALALVTWLVYVPAARRGV